MCACVSGCLLGMTYLKERVGDVCNCLLFLFFIFNLDLEFSVLVCPIQANIIRVNLLWLGNSIRSCQYQT